MEANMMALDRTDREIIGLLQENSRLSNKEIAGRVGIAQSTCSERIKRLERAGVFQGFHADVDPAVMGVGIQAMIAVRLNRHETTQVARLREYAGRLTEVVGFYHMAGANDFLIHVAVRDSNHLRDIAMGAFTAQQEVAHIETSIIFEHTRFHHLPDYR